MNILCDDCLGKHRSMAMARTGPINIGFAGRIEKADPVYRCDICGRCYDPNHGYFNLAQDGNIIRPRTIPLCQCHETTVMYAAEDFADASVLFKCHWCSMEIIHGLDVIEESAPETIR